MEREKISLMLGSGLLALALSACTTIPAETKAYYNAFSDEIKYLDGAEDDEQVVAHEKEHQKRANEYPLGRYIWGIRYHIDDVWGCQEEVAANIAGGYTDIYDHPKCED